MMLHFTSSCHYKLFLKLVEFDCAVAYSNWEELLLLSIFIKQIILNKFRNITPHEVYEYAHNYGFSITRQQAFDIATYVSTNRINPFEQKERDKMLKDLSKITDSETAAKANQLFHELIKSYGLEHLFQ